MLLSSSFSQYKKCKTTWGKKKCKSLCVHALLVFKARHFRGYNILLSRAPTSFINKLNSLHDKLNLTRVDIRDGLMVSKTSVDYGHKSESFHIDFHEKWSMWNGAALLECLQTSWEDRPPSITVNRLLSRTV